eukprot:3744771-Pyramimonas_sp.AAC.1
MLQEQRWEFQEVLAKGEHVESLQAEYDGGRVEVDIDGPPDPEPKVNGEAKSLSVLGMNANAWSTAETAVEWLMDRGGQHGGLQEVPDVLCAQETRLKNPGKVSSATRWCNRRGWHVAHGQARSTGPGPSQ